MGTRCLICVRREDGKVDAVYCHYDGYPSGVGATLMSYYLDKRLLKALIDGGNMSSLGESIETTEFNGNDPAHTFKNLEEAKNAGFDISFMYVIDMTPTGTSITIC